MAGGRKVPRPGPSQDLLSGGKRGDGSFKLGRRGCLVEGNAAGGPGAGLSVESAAKSSFSLPKQWRGWLCLKLSVHFYSRRSHCISKRVSLV